MTSKELELRDFLYKVYFVQCVSRGLPRDIAEEHALHASMYTGGGETLDELYERLKKEVDNLYRDFLHTDAMSK